MAKIIVMFIITNNSHSEISTSFKECFLILLYIYHHKGETEKPVKSRSYFKTILIL